MKIDLIGTVSKNRKILDKILKNIISVFHLSNIIGYIFSQTLKFNIDNESEVIDNEDENGSEELTSEFASSYENTSSYYNRDNTKKMEDEEEDEKEEKRSKTKVSFVEDNPKEKEYYFNAEIRSRKSKISVGMTHNDKRMSQLLSPFGTSGNETSSGQIDQKAPQSIMHNRASRLSMRVGIGAGAGKEEASFRLVILFFIYIFKI